MTRTITAATTTNKATTTPTIKPIFFPLLLPEELLSDSLSSGFVSLVGSNDSYSGVVGADGGGTTPEDVDVDDDDEDDGGGTTPDEGGIVGEAGVSAPMQELLINSNPWAHLEHPKPSAPHEMHP